MDNKITIELGAKANQQLKELQNDLKASSGALVVEDSLKLMKTLKNEVKSGSEIIIENKEGRRKILFL